MGNFQLARIFFSLTACAGIFFSGEPLCTNFFFFRRILLFFEQWNLESLSMFLGFINYSTLTTDESIQATLMQNLFENVHTVREEEATWSGRLPCAFVKHDLESLLEQWFSFLFSLARSLLALHSVRRVAF